jgi:MFS transporter, PPP family, 3-phenylpropionic acid transporter
VKALRLLYLGNGSATAALGPFLAVILATRGLDAPAIGLVNGLGACCLVVAIAFWGHLGDRVLGRRLTLQVCTLVAVGVAICIGLPLPLVALPVLTIAFACSQGALLALTDAVVVSTLKNPGRDYGQIRLMGSISFGCTIILVGFVYNRLGYSVASLFYLVFAIGLIAASFGVAPRTTQDAGTGAISAQGADSVDVRLQGLESGERTRPRLGSVGQAFRIQPQLLPVLATVAITGAAVTVSSGLLSLRIVALGGQPSDVAISFGVSALCEIPGMLLAATLVSRIGLKGLYCAGALGFCAAFLSWSVLTSPSAIVATRAVTGLSFASITVATVLTMGRLLPNHLQATGQALLQGTLSGLASVVGNVLGGLVFGGLGPSVLFLLCAVTCATGGLIALATFPGRVSVRHGSRE